MNIFHRVVPLLFALLTSATAADAERVLELRTNTGSFEAMTCGDAKSPTRAAIYSYGAIVEREGYKAAASKGYDIADFCRSLADTGFQALIPLRNPSHDPLKLIESAQSYLVKAGVPLEKIVLIGFSKGGGITLRAAADLKAPGPVILMSPALTGNYTSDFKSLTGKTMLTLGTRDPQGIQKKVKEALLPICDSRPGQCTSALNFPGDHKWFWSVREEYWKSIREFLNRALS